MNTALVHQAFDIVDSITHGILDKHRGRLGSTDKIELFNMLSEHFDTLAANEEQAMLTKNLKAKTHAH